MGFDSPASKDKDEGKNNISVAKERLEIVEMAESNGMGQAQLCKSSKWS